MTARDDDDRLSEEQKNAISVLASHNVYAKQSKWKTFRELPAHDRWPFFVQHFLLGTLAVATALAVVISLLVTFLTKAPDPVLSVQAIDMGNDSVAFNKLRDGFLKQEKIKDNRLVHVDGSLSLGDGQSIDDSTKIMTMVTAGQINMMVADKADFATLHQRGYISKPSEVLTSAQLRQVADALVDAHGKAVKDPSVAVGLDLSKSGAWTALGLPRDAVIGFSNVQSGKTYPQRFVRYLRFS